jgi:hypothetical protein
MESFAHNSFKPTSQLEPLMPKNNVIDPITDQEIAFARLVLSGTMTDQRAAEAAGLNPTSAAYTKSKPRVRAYMLEHRALIQQQIVEQETESVRRFHVGRDQVLDRLWELAALSAEVTRGSISGQVKALSMIVAIEGLIPDRRAGSAEKNPDPSPTLPRFYQSAWLREQKAKEAGLQTGPGLDQGEDELTVPHTEPATSSAEDTPPHTSKVLHQSEPPFATPVSFLETPTDAFAPGTRLPFSKRSDFFTHRRY